MLDRGGYYGIASVENSGTISAEAATGYGVGWGWGTRVRGQQAELSNSGSIGAYAYAENGYASASAAYVRGGYYGASSNSNSGTIQAHAVVILDEAQHAQPVRRVRALPRVADARVVPVQPAAIRNGPRSDRRPGGRPA